jgi:hypothetical protein
LENYEIRIVKKDRGPVIFACPHASDFAAIRRAQSLAEPEDQVEVWRDLDCVYATRQTGLAAY